VRFIYSKKISGMTYDQILATVDPVLRVNLRKSENEDLKFRYLNYDELDIFDDLLQKTYD
jgi:lipid II:glycine glycyltransferase (peptidoglycan interpeptide bridge formation enzyme)